MKRLTELDIDDIYGLDADEIDELCVQHGVERYDGDDEIDTSVLREKLILCRAEILEDKS